MASGKNKYGGRHYDYIIIDDLLFDDPLFGKIRVETTARVVNLLPESTTNDPQEDQNRNR